MFWARKSDLFWLSILKVLLITALLMIMSVGPAGAGPAKPKKDDGQGADKAEEVVAPLDPHLVFMPALVVPVVERGRLLYYFYVGVQLRVEKVGMVPEVKEHVPLIQDAFIRYVHKYPLNAHGGEGHIDKAALSAALMPSVKGIIGPDLVNEVVIEALTATRRSSVAM